MFIFCYNIHTSEYLEQNYFIFHSVKYLNSSLPSAFMTVPGLGKIPDKVCTKNTGISFTAANEKGSKLYVLTMF